MRLRAAARPAAPCARGRAWSICASWRGSRRDEIAARRRARSGSPALRTYRPRPAARRRPARRNPRGAIDRRIPARPRRRRGRPASAGSDNSRSRRGPSGGETPWPPSCCASICAPRQMPRNGLFSFSGTAIHSISRRMKSVVVVGAHRAAEDDGGGVLRHGLRQRIAEARPAHVERIAQLPQRVADAARRGMSPGAGRSGSAVA